ncbi:hypothetical protein PtA15_8A347 [Puccinia triticina]|uniref:Uncharacterized protein n=1 Tax=Puccinia triticina TaxID=208348 RepID=A0ABY7CQB5_9BASI|nr:uncharacterized protein PtA15_8A347 [Puccinia triticina]WAQ87443.1 hypothetical protein PtA15_8A347 [Puccinia triticina]WAR57296.1 hypothetical protein PtB15_8B343 [Puccinia triticina]
MSTVQRIGSGRSSRQRSARQSVRKCESVRLTIADCPGLLPKASENVGLGHAFLRHIERSKILDLIAGLLTTPFNSSHQDTNLDAALARFLEVSKNYLHELSVSARPEIDGAVHSDYAALFVPASLSSREWAWPPWVNIGTHQRTYMINKLVNRFLLGTAAEGPQVVSLGAGSDSRFWHPCSRLTARWPPLARWFKTKLEPTVRQKIRTITTHKSLRGLCGHCLLDPSATTTPPPNGWPGQMARQRSSMAPITRCSWPTCVGQRNLLRSSARLL